MSHLTIVDLTLAALAGSLVAVPGAAEGRLPYGIAETGWPAELGSHRVVIHVDAPADAVVVHIPWRRRDPSPETKGIALIDASTGERVRNVARIDINREFGEIAFQPATAPGDYYLYTMPNNLDGPEYLGQRKYDTPAQTAEPAWLARHGLADEGLSTGAWRELPKAQAVRIEAAREFARFDPMEVIATRAETDDLIARHPDEPCLLFPEDRRYPIRMTDDLPLCWVDRGPSDEFAGEARPDEFYAFQVGLFAHRKALEDVRVQVEPLMNEAGHTIPANAVQCLDFGGNDWLGRRFERKVSVPEGKVAPLWFGVPIPPDGVGRYTGEVRFLAGEAPLATLRLSLGVAGDPLPDHGDGDLWRQARLRWLDSTIGLDDEIVAPYTPVEVDGHTVECLNRRVLFGSLALPERIESGGHRVLARPVGFIIESADGAKSSPKAEPSVRTIAPGAATASAEATAGPLAIDSSAKMEADGYINYHVAVRATEATSVEDIRFEIPIRREVATYMMGLKRKGGYRPSEWHWKWDGPPSNSFWIGDVEAGLHCRLKTPDDAWDLGSSRFPDAWHNEGKGGVDIVERGDEVVARIYTGARSLAAGQQLDFRFALLITPVKPLDPGHWTQRYYHFYANVVPPAECVAEGANIINIHQGNPLNLNINYPFLQLDKLRPYVDEAHRLGAKAKIYYTVRELSNYTAEIWALRSLGDEVFLDGAGGGDSWLQEHLVSHYASAWHQPYGNGEVDAAIAQQGLSRWHNYYLEGLGWLVREVGIDGLYLDGIGYDREIMKRVRKVLDRARPGCLIDFHSGNNYAYMDNKVSPACQYMEHFPYIDSLWFGEMYDYNETPDYWLVEISGIPFGLYGEMLQGGGHPWRGMVYGMTGRLGWGGDPRPMWKAWDDFGIKDARMVGYWDARCPVRTGRDDVLATAYLRPGKALIAVASWAPTAAKCRLAIDWAALGLDAARAHLYAPAIQSFQREALFGPGDEIPVAQGRGWLLVLDELEHTVRTPPPTDEHQGRRVLVSEGFDAPVLGGECTTSVSPRPGTSVGVANGALAIRADANTYAFAERPLPLGVAMVEVAVSTGTDGGATWGPGLTLLWPDHALRLNVRAEGRFGVDDGTDFAFGGVLFGGSTYLLRIRLEADTVYAEVSEDGTFWDVIHSLPRDRFPGDPTAARIGKTGPGGRAEDFNDPGIAGGACALDDLRAFGPRDR